MIKLELMKICEDCPYLDATADTVEFTVGGTERKIVIRCKHNGICRRAIRESGKAAGAKQATKTNRTS